MQEYLENLNESQREAVINYEGPALVIAGAGSGKTRVLTYRIAYLLNNGIPPSSILALTFTNKAAREMKERIASVVGIDLSRYLWMGTFHSIFSRILRTESEIIGFPSSFTIYDTQDSRSLIKSIIKQLKLDDKIYKPAIVHNKISSAKNNLITQATYLENTQMRERDQASRMPRIGEIYREYAIRCLNAGAMDFDDLLLKTNLLFRDHIDILEKYKSRFKYILVDEYQDTNFSQYLIVKKLAESHNNICVVGDDAQSIYSFRGAKIENILNFRNDYPGYNKYKLEQNYRSTKTIVNAANSLIAKNKHQIQKTVFSEKANGDNIKVLNAITDNEEGYLVVGEIVDLRMQNQNNFADFAILYRTNAQSRIFEESLRKRNIPYKIYGGLSFYQRKEIKDLLAYYRLIINSKDDEAFKRIVNYPARGIGTTTLSRLELSAINKRCTIWEIASDELKAQQAGLNSGSIRKVLDFCSLISGFVAIANISDAYEVAMQVASETGILKDLYNDNSPENITRHENVQELLNAIQEYSISAKEEGRPEMLSAFMEEVALITDQDNDKDENSDKVTLMTVHSSKGLEFKNVFIVGLEENLFPSGYSGAITAKELEEERRLFYVALTRAEETACLSFARQRYRWGSLEFCNPSRFIGEIDDSFLNFQGAESISFTRKESSSKREFPDKKVSRFRSSKAYQPQKGSRTGQIAKQRFIKSGYKPENMSFTGDDPDTFSLGMYVEHQRFGRGKILNIEGGMPNKKAKVFFPNVGEKQLLLKFAKLKISENQG